MQIVHSQLTVPDKVVRPNKKEAYHAAQVVALRRRKFVDFENALHDPEVIELINKVREISPGWEPKFRA